MIAKSMKNYAPLREHLTFTHFRFKFFRPNKKYDMHSKINAAITAVGGYVPEDKLTNADLEKMVDTNDEWIRTRTGITERRILRTPGKATSDMVVPCIKQICEKRGYRPDEIDCLIVATVTPDMVFPATANIAADKAGAKNAWGFDLSAACSGFLYALTVGTSLIESGRYKKVIVALCGLRFQ